MLLVATSDDGCASESLDQRLARSDGPPRAQLGRAPMPDLTEAAERLGVTEDALEQALRDAGGPPPDFAKVAKALRISETDPQAAMSPPRSASDSFSR